MADVAALTSITKSALQLFISLAKDEFLLLWHFGKDLERLRVTIEITSGFLIDAEERNINDLSVQRCLYHLRKVMYDAEDFFDSLSAHLLRKKTAAGNAFTKEVRLFFSKSNQLGFIVKTAHDVKSLRESLDEVSKNMQKFSFIQQPPLPVGQSFTRKETHSFVHQEDIIGRDQEKVRIINMLIPEDKGETSCHQSFSVVAIIGFGGLGKTALAQFVYNDDRVKQGFEVHLWACINYLSNLEQVLKEIIASKVEKKQLDLSVQMLQEKLREIIGGKKFLIVLDDVWDENSGNWLDLETILRCGKRGSRILVTTRSREVAKCLNASEPYCDLRGLSDDSAWSLFVKMAFKGEELSGHPELEPIGKKILSKCGNVPLAIVTIGSLLRRKRRDERTWTEFYDNKLKEVLSGGEDNNIKKVLTVSYNDLHPNLKLCFAACSLFPKDYEFDKDFLVRLWLAQGILKPCGHSEQSLEEVGEAYFFHLVDRCFFQEVNYKYGWLYNFDYGGNSQHTCTAKMHDLLHDMAIDVAKTENLFLDKVPENKGEKDGLRHISIDFDPGDSFDYCSLVSDTKTVRSVLFRHNQKFSLSTFKPFLESFTMLRTLYLSRLEIEGVPESIGGLIHLRYLDLSWNRKLKHLPDSICKLHHLMIFVLEGCKLLEKLPPRIEKLVSLRQLLIDGCDRLDSLPSGLKTLTLLVNLDRLIVHRRGGGLGYLKGLDNLAGVLRIELPEEGWVDAPEDAKQANMIRKNKLNDMFIQWRRTSTTAGEEKMAKDDAKVVLEALRPHENLEYFRIHSYGGVMLSSWFWTLKNVKELCLENCDEVEYLEEGIQGHLGLSSLKLLQISDMRNLKGWWRPGNARGTNRPHLSTVSRVRIVHCPKLKGQMPLFEGIEDLNLVRVDAKVVAELLVPNCSSQSSVSPFYSSNKLMELQLSGIEGLISLPEGWIRHLTALQRLTIGYCMELRWVSRRGLAHLTALKSLTVDCGEIGDEDDEDDRMGSEAGMPWKALQGLDCLRVKVGDRQLLEGLQYLTSLIYLNISQWKDVQLQLGGGEMKAVELSFKPLLNLRELEIGFGDKTFQLPESGIQYLHSLWSLTLENCKELYLSWKTLLFNMKLVELGFRGVESVIDVEEDKMMAVEQQQSQLSTLRIWGAEANWVDDIPWFSLSSSLKQLVLWRMGEKELLPDGIQHLTSLQTMSIYEEVRSLPVWIPKLTSLRNLTIDDCSAELERRCDRGTGEDWPLIRHIPYVRMGRNPFRGEAVIERRDEKEEEEEEGSRKKGGCGGLFLSKFKPRFL